MKKQYKNGDFYEGECTLITRKREGRGKMIYANGDVYEGDWADNMRHGEGVLTRKNGERYEGSFRDDLFSGYGILTSPTLVRYKGSFYQGEFSSLGYLTLPNGNNYYGEFVKGKFDGKGTLYKANGEMIYNGTYKDGLKYGRGEERGEDYVYIGDFTNDKFSGDGHLKYKNGDWVKGNFLCGEPYSGCEGRLTDSDGNVYEGAIIKWSYHGKGRLTMNDGTVYEGNFDSGLMDGLFRVKYPSGKVEEKSYEKGNEVGAAKALRKEIQYVETPFLLSLIDAVSSTGASYQEMKAVIEQVKKTDIGVSQSKEYSNAFQKPFLIGKRITDIDKEINVALENAKKAEEKRDAFYKRQASFKSSTRRNNYIELEKYPGGDTYCGERNDAKQRHGYGIYKYSVGTVFEGEWKNDAIEGLGKIELEDAMYEGELSGGKMLGFGVVTKTGDLLIKGKFKEGETVGTIELKGVTQYCGTMNEKCEPHGYGRTITSEGTKVYGYFEKGVLSGSTKVVYSSGEVYRGRIIQNKNIGLGALYTKDYTEEGEIMASKRVGLTKKTYKNGRITYCSYKNDVLDGYLVDMDGKGVYTVTKYNAGKLAYKL